MKKTFIFTAVLCALLFGCRKNNNDGTSSGYITATVDGATISFNTGIRGGQSQSAGTYSLLIAGFDGPAGSSNQLFIGAGSPSPITTGTYDYSGSLGYIGVGNNNNYWSTNPCIVTITGISSRFIKGTFSGEMLSTTADPSSTNKKVITNGEFVVNF